jgi:serine/threonine-protein kinase
MINRVVSGRYKILHKIGQGGMGAVYIGELVGIGQRVALKFLNTNLSQNPEVARRFLNEAKSYARVSHPNAVVLHDFGQDDEGTLYISMELVEGVDVQKMLSDQGRLGVNEAVEIVLQVSDVLGYAHSKGVIHRDLKPENIMVRKGTRGLHVKVLDFGIARLVEEGSTRLTVQGSIAGTPRYMAPEQADGRDIDSRVDVYALGVVLFELLTGLQPFDAATVREILRKQIVIPMPQLREVAPDLELDELDAVIQKATAKEPGQRYQTMDELAAALIKAAKLEPGRLGLGFHEAPTDPTFLRDSKDFKKTPWPDVSHPKLGQSAKVIWLSLGLLLLLILGAAYRLRPTQNRAEAEARKATGQVSSSPPPVAVQSPSEKEGVAKGPGTSSNSSGRVAQDLQIRQEFFAKEVLVKARNEFSAGNLSSAKAILESVPEEHSANEEVVKLKESLEEIATKLAKGRASAARGDCEAAIRVYEQILKTYPSVREARQGRDECRKMLPPSVAE